MAGGLAVGRRDLPRTPKFSKTKLSKAGGQGFGQLLGEADRNEADASRTTQCCRSHKAQEAQAKEASTTARNASPPTLTGPAAASHPSGQTTSV